MGTYSSYQRLFPVLSPPISNIARRRGSKGEQDAIWPSCVLHNQFFHVGVSRTGDCPYMGTPKCWTMLFKHSYHGGNVFLLFLRESFPPSGELVSYLDFPFHGCNMPLMECSVKRHSCLGLRLVPLAHLDCLCDGRQDRKGDPEKSRPTAARPWAGEVLKCLWSVARR